VENRRIEKIDSVDLTASYYKCPMCGTGTVKIDNSVFYGRCDVCGATLINYEPAPHQEAFHMSTTTYRMLIGGFASGKTTAAVAEDVTHVLTTPHARLLLTAPTLQQMKEAVLPELEKFVPPWFLVGGRSKGNPPVYNFINGSQILVYASDEETKIRSLNLTGFHIEEASGVSSAIFRQLQTRLRNKAAIIYNDAGEEIDYKFMGLISTNPEDGWIKDDFLFHSAEIVGSELVDINAYKHLIVPNPEKEYQTFISTSFDNPYLPRGTIERISAGRDERWKRKYLYSVLESPEGQVWPDIPKHYVEPFAIPNHWKRIVGFDPGIGDPTAALIGAEDPQTHIIYYYDEYYQPDASVTYHSKHLGPKVRPYNLLYPVQADPSVRNRSKETGQTYKAYFKNVTGITLHEATNDLLYTIEKVKDYVEAGKLKFFESLTNFKREQSRYVYAKPTANRSGNKPVDKDNHLMDCLRYSVSPLPRNPMKFNGAINLDEALKNKSKRKTKKVSLPAGMADEQAYNRVYVRRWN